MQVSWTSKQGRNRSSNNDAAAIGIGKHALVAILVDAAQSRQAGGNRARELAHHWCSAIAQLTMQQTIPLNSEHLIGLLKQEQATLRRRYLHEIASYCLAVILPESEKYQLFHCGDCLAGTIALQDDNPSVNWLHQPHTLSAQTNTMAPAATDSSSVLTRCLNARRFHLPDTLCGTLAAGDSLVLASDGHWTGSDSDDNSVLVISQGAQTIQTNTDCENFFIFPKNTAVTHQEKPAP